MKPLDAETRRVRRATRVGQVFSIKGRIVRVTRVCEEHVWYRTYSEDRGKRSMNCSATWLTWRRSYGSHYTPKGQDAMANQIQRNDREWHLAESKYRKADMEACAAFKKAVRPGQKVSWRHGRHVRSGVVENVTGVLYHTMGARVRAKNGALVDVSAYRLLDFLREGARFA